MNQPPFCETPGKPESGCLMTVEKAGADEIDALVKLRLAYLNEDKGPLSDHETGEIRKQLPGYFRDHLNKDLFVYVIRSGDTIAACAFLLVIEKPMSPAFLNGKTGTVLNVYTVPSYRRKGCAQKIMRTMLAEAEKKAVAVIELKSTDAGYDLYRSIGFSDDRSDYHLLKWINPCNSLENPG